MQHGVQGLSTSTEKNVVPLVYALLTDLIKELKMSNVLTNFQDNMSLILINRRFERCTSCLLYTSRCV